MCSPVWGNSWIVCSIGASDFAISGEIGAGAGFTDPLVLPRLLVIMEDYEVFNWGFFMQKGSNSSNSVLRVEIFLLIPQF
jgi:hypothetical protein